MLCVVKERMHTGAGAVVTVATIVKFRLVLGSHITSVCLMSSSWFRVRETLSDQSLFPT